MELVILGLIIYTTLLGSTFLFSIFEPETNKKELTPYEQGKRWVNIDILLEDPQYYAENEDGKKTYYFREMMHTLMTEHADTWANLSYTPHTDAEPEEQFWQGVYDAILEGINYQRDALTAKQEAKALAKAQQSTIDEIL